jgi:hypothetical protein
MQRVTDQVDSAYLERVPPRPLHTNVMLNLLNDHLYERLSRIVLDPITIASMVILIGLVIVHASPLLRLIPVLLIFARLGIEGRYIWLHVSDDLALLRNGLTVRAHVLKLRPHRSLTGEIDGALLDCAIPVAPRRTYVGSIWLADGTEAVRLARQGRLEVICLPRTPGTWRVIEDVRSEIRYDRVGPVQQIPHDI